MNLQPFCFPVTERAVAVDNAASPLIDLEDKRTFLSNGYKAVVRADTNLRQLSEFIISLPSSSSSHQLNNRTHRF
ncbi:MAG: hypothetical protein JJU37_00425 [Balneolaceae bacterium]|nr:hypothetical protein [Balneolaceae bacterium]